MNKDEEVSFENAFARLEEILEKLNSSSIPLEESLKLYEEADKLITCCATKLAAAEKKVDILIKQRNGELLIGDHGVPITETFSSESSKEQNT